jgi:hypothetical protein
MAKEIERILDECIDRLLQGESVEQCLQDYPEQAAELEPLLRVSLAAQKASAIEPRPEFKAKVRYQIQSALHAEKEKRQPRGIPFFGLRPRWAVTAVVSILVFFIAGGSVVAASTNSLPDETLYPVKLAVEKVQMALTFSEMSKAKLNMKFANRRIQEIARMLERDKPAQQIELAAFDLAPRLTTRLEMVRRLAEAELRKAAESKRLIELRAILQQKASEGQVLLQRIQENVPVPAEKAIIGFISNSRLRYEQALEAAGVPAEAIKEIEGRGPSVMIGPSATEWGKNQAKVGKYLSYEAAGAPGDSESSLSNNVGVLVLDYRVLPYLKQAGCLNQKLSSGSTSRSP